MTAENRLHFQAKKEAIFLILTGIVDEIYSTVDACNTAKEMWTPLKGTDKGIVITTNQAPKPQRSNAPSNKQSSSTLTKRSARHKGKEIAKPVTPQSESVSEEDSDQNKARRDKDSKELGTKSLLSILKMLRARELQPKLRTSSNSKNKTEDTTPRYNNDNQSRQFGNQRTMTVAGARETVGSPVVQQNGIQCFNCKGFWNLCQLMQEAKRQADWLEDTDEEIDEQELEAHYSYMAKIQEVSPAESSSTDTPLEQKDDSDVIPDSSNICTNDNQVDQNAAECVDERAALANLIANLTLDMEENKTVQKQLKKANASLTQELKECKTNLDESSRAWGWLTSIRSIRPFTMLAPKRQRIMICPVKWDDGEDTVTLEKESRSKLDKDTVKPYNYTHQNSLYETFKPPSKTYLDQLERFKEIRKTMWRKTFVRTKPNIAKNIGFLPMSKSISKSRLLYNEMTNNFNHFRTICQQTWSNHTSSAFPNPTAKSMEVLIKILLMPLSDKTILDSHCFIHELKREMNDDLEYVNSLEKELDELESEKADFSNIYDLLLEECVSKDVTCSYLHSLSDLNANTELQCLYLHKVKECECLAQKLSKQTESVNKEVHNNLLKSFAKLEKHSISLELSLQHCKEQMKNNPVCKENASNVFRKEREQYHEIQDLKAQMQDKNMVINELKKLILVTKGKSVETQFDKPSVVRQPNAQRIPKPSVLGKPTPFSNSPEMRSFQTKQSVNKTNVSDGLFKPVTQQSNKSLEKRFVS
ncbi:hypothetical protein Tco_0821029 [Tanacetum coccineum]|uniref:Kinesin-like protein n=1 Tax=Tanacetum coccineum TaxID=301880 RepID=A0ABQ5AB44_9ASTR